MIQYEETRYLFLLIMIPILIIGYLIFYYWKKSILKTIFNQKQNQFFQAWLDDLKEDAEIVDNRKFYF